MAKEKEPRYVIELDLFLELFQLHILEKRLEIARHIYNCCKGKMLENISLLRQDENYRYWLKQEKSEERTANLKEFREAYDVSKTGAERIVKDMGKHFLQKKPKNKKNKQKVHLDSHVVQKIASAVWESVSDYLFSKKTKKVHFKKYGNFHSVEGKNNKAGLTYENGILYWNGLQLKVLFPKPGTDTYLESAMHDEIAFCRLIRKVIRGRVKYYLQLVMKGIPPQKHEPKEGKVGMDIGISTIAAVSNEEIKIQEFCEGLKQLENEKRLILRQMDRSRRATNPNKYNADKTIKKGNKDKWVRSKRYWKLLFQLKEICRKIAAVRELMHNELANTILDMGNQVFVEKMNYAALKRTRFGKQISHKAPSTFLSIVERKLGYQGQELQYINTWTVKASQYCPILNTYVKKPLSQRFHTLPCGNKVQRDIFSAWLIKNVNSSKTKVNRKVCLAQFSSFFELYNQTKENLLSLNKKFISSIGF